MFKIFYINNCYYSRNAINLIKEYDFNHKLILYENNNITDKDYNIIVKTYSSFPKIFYKLNDTSIFIGGNQELISLLSLLHKLINNTNYVIKSQKYIDKYYTCLILYNIIDNYY
jgi:arsenate reductase-like glutaredoxin family protein